MTNSFEAPTNIDDNYGTRMRALVVPPLTGSYTFWIASDDNSTLFLSTDSTPANKRLVASVPGWTNSRNGTLIRNKRQLLSVWLPVSNITLKLCKRKAVAATIGN